MPNGNSVFDDFARRVTSKVLKKAAEHTANEASIRVSSIVVTEVRGNMIRLYDEEGCCAVTIPAYEVSETLKKLMDEYS